MKLCLEVENSLLSIISADVASPNIKCESLSFGENCPDLISGETTNTTLADPDKIDRVLPVRGV